MFCDYCDVQLMGIAAALSSVFYPQLEVLICKQPQTFHGDPQDLT